jgi:Ca2+-binding EF-hand superfamily protein
MIAALEHKVETLSHKISELMKKNKLLTDGMEKKKKQMGALERQVKDLKRQASYKEPKGIPGRPKVVTSTDDIDIVAAPTHPIAPRSATPKKSRISIDNSENEATNSNILEIAKSYKARLDSAEDQLRLARDENDRLRGLDQLHQRTPSRGDNLERDDVAMQLRDAKWRLQQLQTQYDHAVSKAEAQQEAYKLSEEQIEENARKVRELRRALEDLRHEKEITDIKAARVTDLEEAVIELRQTNRSLEDKISRLCEAPFISDAFGQHEAKLEFEKVMLERQDYVAKVDHLQEAVRTQYSALVALKQQAAQLREEKEAAERVADELRAKYSELEAGANLLQDKLRLYSGEDGVNIEDLERALTVVKRRSEAVGKLDFLEDVDGLQDITMPMLKKKSQEVQILNLNLTKEVERLENMLKLQSNINRDLHKELESMVHKRDRDKREASEKSDDFEELAMRRLNKIHTLEAQIRELVYGMAKKGAKHRPQMTGAGGEDLPRNIAGLIEEMTATSDAGTDNVLLAELLEERNGEIDPDENLLEVWIKGASVRDGIVMPGSSTFVVVDFFDYESQTTSLLSGSSPKWDFGATFKIAVDDFLLRHLATDTITFELNMASQGDFSMLACCTAPLSALLRAKPLLRLTNHPMISPRTGEIVAHLDVEIRLALPLSELYRLFLERHPEERRAIEEKSAQRVLASANAIEKAKMHDNLEVSTLEDESRMYNELEVAIFQIKDLPKHGNSPPTPYVHFQLLGHPDKFTNPITSTSDPTFNERFNFPMLTNDQQCRLLRRSQLLLSVIDMKGEEANDDGEGLIGEVNIALAPLSEGSAVNDTFTVKNQNGDRVGLMRIAIRWVHKFRPQRELGPRALTGVEVETLISTFCPGINKEGVVDYISFLRFVHPPIGARVGMEKIHTYLRNINEREGIPAAEILKSITENVARVDRDLFIRCFSRLEIDVLPEEWGDLFKFIDYDDDGSITVDQMLAILNLDEVAGISPILQEKLTLQVRNIVSRGVDPLEFFQDLDNWGEAGRVTRMEFKLVLKKMGFQLVDEPENDGIIGVSQEKYVGNGTPINVSGSGIDVLRPKLRNSQQEDEEIDLLNDTFESDEVLQPAGQMDGNIGDEIRRQKEIFQKKLDDIQQRTSMAASRQQKLPTGDIDESVGTEDDDRGKGRRGQAPESSGIAMSRAKQQPVNQEESKTFVGKNILDGEEVSDNIATPRQRQDDHFKGEHADRYADQDGHRTSVSANGGAMEYDSDVYQKSATKIQSRYRGLSARKGTPSPPQSKNVGKGAIAQSPQHASTSPTDIISAENHLRGMIDQLEGVKQLPNFQTAFATVDSKQTGYVSRKQFAHVMNQFDHFRIPHAELRAFMDYFDSGSEGLRIDYGAFVRFVRYRPLDILPAVRHLQRVVMLPDTIVAVRSLDVHGTGFLSRQDMLRVLADLGYGHFSNSQALAMLALFETRVDGQVNYGNFIEFIRDNELSRSTDKLCEAVRGIVTEKGGLSENNLRRWYKRLDKEGAGSISRGNFAEFLAEFDLEADKAVVSAAYSSISESNGSLVTFPAFCAWVGKKAENHAALYPTMTLAELQRKTNAYLWGVAGHKDSSLEQIAEAYLIYDWKNPSRGSLRRPEFIRATQHAGFVFTHAELRALCSEFKSNTDSHQVLYKKFLGWATPPEGGASGDRVGDRSTQAPIVGIADKSSHTRVAAILKTIEKSIERGTDLLSVFGRYDTNNIGRITADEFCSGLSDLGLSSLSQKDAFDLADKYKAAVGGFILYRRVFTELLNQMDEKKGVSDVDIVDALIAAMRKCDVPLEKLRDVFEYYDRGKRSRVREEDLGTIFEEARIRISRLELEATADKFAAGSSGWIQYVHLLSVLQARMGRGSSADFVSSNVAGISDHLAQKVSNLLESLILRGKDFRAELDTFDSNYSGSILQTDFREVFQDRFHSGLSVHDMATLEKLYRDPSDSRKVSHVKMLHDLHPQSYGKATTEQLAVMQLGESLRQKIRRRCDYLTPGELKRPYRHFARRKAHLGFTADELGVGLKDLGMKLSGDMEVALFNAMNLDGGRAVRYNHFVVFVSDPYHDDMKWKFQRAMARARVSETEIMDALDEFDSNSSGLITAKQFAKALMNCNMELSDSDISRFMLRFDNDEAQRFDVELFGKFLSGKLEFTNEDTKSSRMSDRDSTRELDTRESRSHRVSMEAVESRVFGSLRRRVAERMNAGFTEREVFALFDEGSGTVSLMSLQKGGRELGLSLSRSEARTVLRKLSLSAGGIVDKLTFFDSLAVDHDLVESPRGSRSRERGVEGRYRRSDRDDESRRDTPVLTSGLQRIVDSVQREMKRASDGEDHERGLRSALKHEDVDRDGLVRKREFARAIELIDTSLSSGDISKLFEYLDSADDDDGFVSISSILRLFGGGSLDHEDRRSGDGERNRDHRDRRRSGSRDSRRSRSSERKSGHARLIFRKQPYLLEDLLSVVKELDARGRRLDGDFLSDCRKADRRGDGNLDKLTFTDCLRSGGLRLRPETERDLCDSLQDSGGIDYRDFVKVVMEAYRGEEDMDDVFRDLKKKIAREVKEGLELTEIFDLMDKDRSGMVSLDEFKDGLRKIGISINRDESKKIMDKFALQNGSIRFRDFITACGPNSKSPRDDKAAYVEV